MLFCIVCASEITLLKKEELLRIKFLFKSIYWLRLQTIQTVRKLNLIWSKADVGSRALYRGQSVRSNVYITLTITVKYCQKLVGKSPVHSSDKKAHRGDVEVADRISELDSWSILTACVPSNDKEAKCVFGRPGVRVRIGLACKRLLAAHGMDAQQAVKNWKFDNCLRLGEYKIQTTYIRPYCLSGAEIM